MAMQQDPIDWRYLAYIYIRPIFQAYVSEYPHKIWPYMVLTYLHQLDPEMTIEVWSGLGEQPGCNFFCFCQPVEGFNNMANLRCPAQLYAPVIYI